MNNEPLPNASEATPADAPAPAGEAAPVTPPAAAASRPAVPSLPPPAEGVLDDAEDVPVEPLPAAQPPPVAWVPLEALDEDAAFALRPAGEVDRLATDIARVGQLVPVDLRPSTEGRYQVVAGFRRVHALRLLQRDKVLARVHPGLTDEDALLLALAPAIHQTAVPLAQLASARDRLAAEGRLTGLLRDMLEKALTPDDALESEYLPSAEEEVDADELALTTAARLAELNQDLALLADVYAGLEDGRKLELLRQLRYASELVAYLEKA
jgi:ParB family chromosome partitioning protein